MDRFIPKGGTYIRGGGPGFDAELRYLWNKTRSSVTGDPPPEDPEKNLTLETRQQEERP
jgi:hypothetical protein